MKIVCPVLNVINRLLLLMTESTKVIVLNGFNCIDIYSVFLMMFYIWRKS